MLAVGSTFQTWHPASAGGESTNRTRVRCARATLSETADGSTPVTRAPRRAYASLMRPPPQPMSRTSRVLVAETARAQDAVEVREASRVECIEPAERTTRPPPGLCEPVVELVVHGHDVRIADARRSSKPHLGCGGLRVRVGDRVASPLSTIPANPTPPNGTATAVRSDCTAGRRPTSELERQVRRVPRQHL